MLPMILRKMLKNLWIVLALLAGLIIAVAMISSIPMYSDGILQRMLTKDLESYQIQRRTYPGRLSVRYSLTRDRNAAEQKARFFETLDRQINETFVPGLGLPVKLQTEHLKLSFLTSLPVKQRVEEPKKLVPDISAWEGFRDHIQVVHGRMFSPEPVDGVYEVMVSEQALQELRLFLGEDYVIYDLMSEEEMFTVRVVGVYTMGDTRDLYWFRSIGRLSKTFMMDHGLFLRDIAAKGYWNFSTAEWHYALDYYAIDIEDLPDLLARYDQYTRVAQQYRVDFDFPAISILEAYNQRAKVLRTTLWFLEVPIFIMLVFFIYMVSQLIIDNDRTEIAVLKSRGASSGQIFTIYLMESLILSAAALVVGPPFGMFVCQVIGSSNGFMEFVQRSALPIELTLNAYLYSLIGVAAFVVTMLVPAFSASRTTIVQHKQESARSRGSLVWKRYFLDLILIAVSMYGLYSYQAQRQILIITGVEGSSLPLDPLLFIISILFILGAGLFFLRIYPYLVQFVFWLFKDRLPPVLYSALVQVGRSFGHEQFLMIFLILSLALGVFNSTTARTINRNIEEKIYYMNGADITLEQHWEAFSPTTGALVGQDGGMGMGMDPVTSATVGDENIQYREPRFEPLTKLAGVEHVTKVFRHDRVVAYMPDREAHTVQLMAVTPDDFGRTAWFRPDLLPHHWYNYLNLLAQHPKAVLVSSTLRDKASLKQGDTITFTWASQAHLTGYIYGFIDYWPGYNPHPAEAGRAPRDLVVANLHYIHAKMAMEPYEVWMRKQDGAPTSVVFDDIEASNIDVKSLTDASQQVVREKNDPMLQGTNGALTMGFVVTMAVSVVGFIVYWVLSLKSRILQFGILRAMGLAKGQVIGTLIWEQVFISGVAILMGVVIGQLAGALFIPLLQLVYSAAEQVPPFRIVTLREDLIQVYVIAAVMLGIGIVMFRMLVQRIRIYEAVKLGEE